MSNPLKHARRIAPALLEAVSRGPINAKSPPRAVVEDFNATAGLPLFTTHPLERAVRRQSHSP